ncbi:transcriptional regulator, AsnC family [Candidatus Vecturithrix granuli]|uniref:siroheme decarboxylase n=1 Tax=Vecturithrix granuli TaxID=1499967 RepID=A0A081C6U2_VECG1|nr:transcriptional regulator, AsnC family [Candidatus Vecturithrix granuli]
MYTLTEKEQQLLDLIQRHFPCTSKPYQVLAEMLGASEQEVLTLLHSLKERGIIRQISAIFDAKALGFHSTLAAFQIENERLDAAAKMINSHPGVSHNYQRAHRFNLWFTLSIPRDLDLIEHLSQLAQKTSCAQFLNLPAIRMFKRQVYLNFSQQQNFPGIPSYPEPRLNDSPPLPEVLPADIQRCLMRELQNDLPLIPTPFYDIASRCDVKEETVLKLLTTLKTTQKIRRFAAILRHTSAGFTANAMVVWKIPDRAIQSFTDHAVKYDAISHCYERLTASAWSYNIYTMIHGRTHADIENIVADLAAYCDETPQYQALYTVKEYKKQRVDYFSEAFYEWDRQQNESV